MTEPCLAKSTLHLSENFINRTDTHTAFRGIVRDFELHTPSFVWELYIHAEHLMTVYESHGKFSKNEVLTAPLTNRETLQFGLCEFGATLSVIDKNGKEYPIVTSDEKSRYDKEIIKKLIQSQRFIIGHAAPKNEFINLLEQIRVGDAILFDGGAMFYCEDSTPGKVVLRPCVKNTNPLFTTFSDFIKQYSKNNTVVINYYDTDSFTELYMLAKSKTTGNIIPRICKDIKNSGSVFVENLKRALKDSETKKLTIGNTEFVVQKNNDDIQWFYNKMSVPEILVKQYITYLSKSPIVTRVNYKQSPDFETRLVEYGLRENLDVLLPNGEYKLAGKLIAKFCKETDNVAAVKLSGFVDPDNKERFSACTYVFFCADGKVCVEKITHNNNNFKQILRSEASNYNEFASFCEKKQMCEYKLLKLRYGEFLLQSGITVNNTNEFEKKVQSVTDANNIPAFSSVDVGSPSKQIRDFVQSFKAKKHKI